MEAAPMRILKPLNFNRHITTTFFPKPYSLNLSSSPLLLHYKSLSSIPNSSRLRFFLSLSSSSSSNCQIRRINNLNHFNSHTHGGGYCHWHRGSAPISVAGVPAGGKCEVAAVLLGWLGATPKHLRRYAELYTCRGIDAITFVVPVKDLLWFDLGRKVENRIRELANELLSWLENDDGRERCLIFHTFSNTGWLVYGAILAHMQERPDLIGRIKGCIVDSGGDPELNPKVWAAGFTAALLKKRNTATSPLADAIEPGTDEIKSKFPDEDPLKIEASVLIALEKMFSFLFKLPDVNQKLLKIISLLSENQPPCPQLYLYSTADKVIPYRSVESFIEHQKEKGRNVWSFNFETSPHVDHYRTFPDVYSSQVNNFLNKSLVMV